MFGKYFYFVVLVNVIINVKSQAEYDDYGDDDVVQQSTRAG